MGGNPLTLVRGSWQKLANKSENGEDLLELNPINVKTLLSAIDKDLQILSDDEQVIEENGNLYDRHYKQALKEIESLNWKGDWVDFSKCN